MKFPVAGLLNFEADGLHLQMMLAFEQDLILKIYKQMVGDELTEINSDILDCIGELTNTVYGFAKAPLVDQGHVFSLARPKSTQDLNSVLIGKKSLEIPFRTSLTAEKEFSLILSI